MVDGPWGDAHGILNEKSTALKHVPGPFHCVESELPGPHPRGTIRLEAILADLVHEVGTWASQNPRQESVDCGRSKVLSGRRDGG